MDKELEIVAAASLGGLAGTKASLVAPPGSPCANCGAILQGPFCHACGQLAEDFERSLWSLLKEAAENFFDTDSRLFRTLPRLALRPGRLTRDYLAGKRVSQLPPLRLFLVVVVLFFLAGNLRDIGKRTEPPKSVDIAPSSISFEGAPILGAFGKWVKPRVVYAAAHPREFMAEFEVWLNRLAILFLPISTALLTLLFPFSRRFKIYDHAIFSMHSLAFMGLLFTAITLLSAVPLLRPGFLAFLAPLHLFFHMRGVYGVSAIGTLLRMAILFVLTLIVFAAAMGGVVLADLAAIGPS